MNKKLLFIPLALISLTSLIGCGGDDSKTIEFWHTFGHTIQTEVNKQITKFEKIIKETEGVDLKIKATYAGGYDECADKIVKGFATGSTPTITVAYPDNVATYLSKEPKKGAYVANLDTYINDPEIGLKSEEKLNPGLLGVEDIVPSFYDEGQHYVYSGTYSMPYMKSTELMLYNKDIVPQVLKDMGISTGVDAYMKSLTWEQLMNILNYVNDNREKYDFVSDDKFPLFYDSDANLFISQCYQRGIDYISMDENGNASVDFVNDEAKSLVAELKQMHDDGLLITKGSNSNEYGSNNFKAGKCLFVVGSTGGSAYSDPGASFEVGVTKFPVHTSSVDTERAKYVSQGVTLALLNNPANSKEVNDFKTKYGWKLIKYLTNSTNSINSCLASAGYIPSRYSSYEDTFYEEYYQGDDYLPTCTRTIIEEMDGKYFNYPVFKGSDIAREQVGAIITNVFEDKWEIDKGFEDAYETTVKNL